MKLNLKKTIAEYIAKFILPFTYNSQSPLDMLCRDVCRFYFNKISQENILVSLQDYYSKLDPETIKNELNLAKIKNDLAENHGYKHIINDPKPSGLFTKLRIRNRRLAIMQKLGMKIDVIILRENDYIPPHGHKRMVSGFFVLEGSIGVRHYKLVTKNYDSMIIKQTVDSIYSNDEFTSNSDSLDNIHWLKGIANESFLYRVSIIDKHKEYGKNNMGAEERIYINPTAPPDGNGLIHAPYINEEFAKNLTFSSIYS
jgi:hypothetical protein